MSDKQPAEDLLELDFSCASTDFLRRVKRARTIEPIAMSRTYISHEERNLYYAGLPSRPVLIARTGEQIWVVPPGPEAYTVPMELDVVGNHPITQIWEEKFAAELHLVLESRRIMWTSTDVVRMSRIDESSSRVILWIGVAPNTLPTTDGLRVAFFILELLKGYNITDVEVEIRESVYSRYVGSGPKLLAPARSTALKTAGEPISTSLGLPICAADSTWAEGTGGFFISKNDPSDNILYLVTARHVVFPPGTDTNVSYEPKNKSQPRRSVVLLGDAGFNEFVKSVGEEISDKEMVIGWGEKRVGKMDLDDPTKHIAEFHLQRSKDKKAELELFLHSVEREWSPLASRIVGHVVLSPRIGCSVGSQGYTEDFAVIAMDAAKVNPTNFVGNVIHLGREKHFEFTKLMYPNVRNRTSFKFPEDRLLKLGGMISDKDLRTPLDSDQDGENCIMVIKRGISTGLTIGRASNIMSYTREYSLVFEAPQVSKAWAIFPRSSKSGPFSAKGDSGAVIVDGRGRLGGLLTGGTGNPDLTDITYATPIGFLFERMEQYNFHAHLSKGSV